MIAGVLAMCAAVAGPTVAGGQPAEILLLRDAVQSEEEAVAQDLKAVAAAAGWSAEEAAAYWRSEEAVGDLALLVSVEQPDAIVGSTLAENPLDPATLYVKGVASPWLETAAKSAGVIVRDNQPLSFDELQARSDRVQHLLAGQGYQVSTLFRFEGGGIIEVELITQDGLPSEPSAIVELLPSDLRDHVSITTFDKPQGAPEAAFGGMRTRKDVVTDWCTSGFTVVRFDGVRGVGSAGHCGASVDRIAHLGHGVHVLTHKASLVGNWGDLQWFTTSTSEPDDFVNSTGSVRDVATIERAGQLSEGEFVCAYGLSSDDADCGLQIAAVSVSGCDGSGLNRQVRMDGDTQIPGDSGGPWYFSTRAYGVHRGGCVTSGNDHFSPVDYFDDAFSVTVATSP